MATLMTPFHGTPKLVPLYDQCWSLRVPFRMSIATSYSKMPGAEVLVGPAYKSGGANRRKCYTRVRKLHRIPIRVHVQTK